VHNKGIENVMHKLETTLYVAKTKYLVCNFYTPNKQVAKYRLFSFLSRLNDVFSIATNSLNLNAMPHFHHHQSLATTYKMQQTHTSLL
jgi:hypothetical protein